MRAVRIDRVKRELLRNAVTDNLDTIRGLPPQRVWPERARGASVRIALMSAGALLLAGLSYVAVSESRGLGVSRPVKQPIARTTTPPTPRNTETTQPDSFEPVRAAAFPLAVRRVVIDAGHGGSDPGASAASQLTEKAITLDIAQRLRALLQSHGFEVVVTRADDSLVPLRERARLANTSNGDIFLSIHVNSIREHTVSHGVETYYLGPTKDPLLTQLAAQENTASGYSMADLRKLLDRVYADVRRDESQRLASAVQGQLFTDLRANDPGLENWGVKRAPFIVLVATEMPAVLAEVGCLSNDREAAMLKRPDYRQQIAQALFRGIDAYAKKGT